MMIGRFPFAGCWILLSLIFTFFASDAWAWGEEGHSIVAEIAQRRLSLNAAQAITQILRANPNATAYTAPSLASVSTWADEVRYNGAKPNETYNWHFVDIPRQDTRYDLATECPKEKPEQGDCVINELARLKNELRCSTGDLAASRAQIRRPLRRRHPPAVPHDLGKSRWQHDFRENRVQGQDMHGSQLLHPARQSS